VEEGLGGRGSGGGEKNGGGGGGEEGDVRGSGEAGQREAGGGGGKVIVGGSGFGGGDLGDGGEGEGEDRRGGAECVAKKATRTLTPSLGSLLGREKGSTSKHKRLHMKELQDGLLALKSRPPAIFTAADWEKLVVRNGLADENETIGADEFVAVASSSVLSILMHELGMVDATMPSLDVASSHQGSSFAAIASGIKAILLWLNLHTIHTDKRASGCGGEGGRVGGGRRIADEERGRGCDSEGVSVNGLIAEEKSRQQVGEVMGQILQELKELNSRVAFDRK